MVSLVSVEVLNYVVPVGLTLFSIAMILYVYRVFKGPTVPDMVLALDTLVVDLIVIFMLITLYYGNPYLAIGAIPLASWVFLLDIIVAKYLMRGGRK